MASRRPDRPDLIGWVQQTGRVPPFNDDAYADHWLAKAFSP